MSLITSAVVALIVDSTFTSAKTLLNSAESAYITLQSSYYNSSSGLWNNDGNWWCNGNTLTTISNLVLASPDAYSSIESVVANTFTQAQTTNLNFLNGFYDDEGWWALAWLAAYNTTSEPSYLAMAETIFADMTNGWNPAGCYGGGVWWRKPSDGINAIENELFFQVAAELALTDSYNADSYLAWAEKSWEWFASTRMINSDNLVNDGLNTTTCQNNNGTIWSYNQGVLIGGLVRLYQATSNSTYLEIATSVAEAAIATFQDSNGVLVEWGCHGNCDTTAAQFKGVLVRNLMYLQRVSPMSLVRNYLQWNANAAIAADMQSDFYGQFWQGPFQTGGLNSTTQASALDLLIAAEVA